MARRHEGTEEPVVCSKNGVPIRLTEERWTHIASRHPEMRDLRESLLATVAEPALILEGDFGTLMAVRFQPGTPITDKHLVAVYREVSALDGFVITAYLANRPSAWRKVLWRR